MTQQVDVAVIGAGVAGLSAAVRLAAAGLTVAVFERAPRLGGRASAFTDRASGERVDNGQHVLFGCYRETYDLLRLVGAAELAPLQPRLRLPMAGPDGRIVPLVCPDVGAPWHLLAGLLRWPALPLTDRLAALRVGRVLRRARGGRVNDLVNSIDPSLTVDDWLDHLGQPAAVRQWLWHPLTVAALNETADVAAARPFVRVVADLFGPSRHDSAVGLARVPLDELYAEPARRFVEARGGHVLLRTPAEVVVDGSRAVGVMTREGEVRARAVVSSVPWFAFGSLWRQAVPPALETIAAAAAAMRSSPIVTVNLWFDGPVMDEPFIGLVGAPIHWVFDKAAIVGERLTHLAVVTSAADHLASADNDAVTRATLDAVAAVLPRAGGRRLMRSVVVREHRATFSVAPGEPARPGPATGVEGFFLAGDWTDTGLPATIEGAALSGRRAAELVAAFLRQA